MACQYIKKVGIKLDSHTVKLKQTNMLCNKCVMRVLKALARLDEIQELEVDLGKKLVRVVYDNESLSRDIISELVSNAIEKRAPKVLSAISYQ